MCTGGYKAIQLNEYRVGNVNPKSGRGGTSVFRDKVNVYVQFYNMRTE